MTVTDVLGRQVQLESMPQRVISLTPANTEILFSVGADWQLIGVTTYCNYPAEAKKVEPVGGFLPKSISLEKIVSLKPDVVFAGGGIHASTIEALQRLGVKVLAVEPRSFADVFHTIKAMGELTGHAQQAEKLVASLQKRYDDVVAKTSAIPADDKYRVFYQVDAKPLTTTGPQSFIGQMVDAAGGVNIFADLEKPFPQVNQEAVVARDPQVIFAPSPEQSGGTKVKTEHGWEGIYAVRNEKIYYLDADHVSRPGPRRVHAVEAAARAMYPDRFPADN